MRYKYSNIDKNNFSWFKKDDSCASLASLELTTGHLRGLYPFKVDFKYPISVMVGENCSGKSTFLALAACAFHNTKSGYKPPYLQKTYYTFSDFFLTTGEETTPEGISISCYILYNNWKGGKASIGRQVRRKKTGGKWNNYDSRVDRNVIYFGVQRVVPHFERSASRSYKSKFVPGNLADSIKSKIREIAGRIIGKSYSDFSIHQHSKYKLPVVIANSIQYSGFNMGAGESAIFEILTAIFEAGRGSLLVIDEIELGLHEGAQKRFIQELKLLCKELHIQIVCSSHSPVILESLPPEARFYLESSNRRTTVSVGISAQYANGKLAGRGSDEITIFVEDAVSGQILSNVLPFELRERSHIMPIGSSEAVLRQLAARYREKKECCLVLLDEDKRIEHSQSMKKIMAYLENQFDNTKEEMKDWINRRLLYLPGDTWPEKWLIQKTKELKNIADIAFIYDVSEDRLQDFLDSALLSGKHNEIYSLAQSLHLKNEQVLTDITRTVKESDGHYFGDISGKITALLNDS